MAREYVISRSDSNLNPSGLACMVNIAKRSSRSHASKEILSLSSKVCLHVLHRQMKMKWGICVWQQEWKERHGKDRAVLCSLVSQVCSPSTGRWIFLEWSLVIDLKMVQGFNSRAQYKYCLYCGTFVRCIACTACVHACLSHVFISAWFLKPAN